MNLDQWATKKSFLISVSVNMAHPCGGLTPGVADRGYAPRVKRARSTLGLCSAQCNGCATLRFASEANSHNLAWSRVSPGSSPPRQLNNTLGARTYLIKCMLRHRSLQQGEYSLVTKVRLSNFG